MCFRDSISSQPPRHKFPSTHRSLRTWPLESSVFQWCLVQPPENAENFQRNRKFGRFFAIIAVATFWRLYIRISCLHFEDGMRYGIAFKDRHRLTSSENIWWDLCRYEKWKNLFQPQVPTKNSICKTKMELEFQIHHHFHICSHNSTGFPTWVMPSPLSTTNPRVPLWRFHWKFSRNSEHFNCRIEKHTHRRIVRTTIRHQKHLSFEFSTSSGKQTQGLSKAMRSFLCAKFYKNISGISSFASNVMDVHHWASQPRCWRSPKISLWSFQTSPDPQNSNLQSNIGMKILPLPCCV